MLAEWNAFYVNLKAGFPSLLVYQEIIKYLVCLFLIRCPHNVNLIRKKKGY